MKKILTVLVSALVLLVLALSGCTSSSPAAAATATTVPTSAPTSTFTPTPVTATNGAIFDDFTDGNLTCSIGAVTGTWSSGNDSVTGGTSSVTSFGVVSDADMQLGITATVQTSIVGGSGGFADLNAPADHYGYVYDQLDLSGPVNLTANNSNGFQIYIFSPAGTALSYRIYVYDSLGRSCWGSWYTTPVARTQLSCNFTGMTVPSSSSYVAADVLAAAAKFMIVFKQTAYGFASQSVFAVIDGFGVY